VKLAEVANGVLGAPVCLGLSVGSFLVIPQLMAILWYAQFFAFSSAQVAPAPKAAGAVCVAAAVAVLAICVAGYVRVRKARVRNGLAVAALIMSALAVVLALALFARVYLGSLGGPLN
jgi:hypothetical protein